jgi:hypothetical protein
VSGAVLQALIYDDEFSPLHVKQEIQHFESGEQLLIALEPSLPTPSSLELWSFSGLQVHD